MRILAAIVALAMVAVPAAAAPRVLSLDSCADQYVLELADRDQIAAVSPRAQQDDSWHRDRARGLPVVRDAAESAAALKPDIAVRAWGGGALAERWYPRLGIRIVSLQRADDFAGVAANIMRVAEALDQGPRGAALVAAMEARLAAVDARVAALGPRPAALYLTPAGVTTGEGGFLDMLIRRAGFTNAAAEAGLAGWGTVPLEELVLAPPGQLVTAFFETGATRTATWSPGRHPRIRRLLAETPAIALPSSTVTCPAWFAVDALERMTATVEASLDADP